MWIMWNALSMLFGKRKCLLRKSESYTKQKQNVNPELEVFVANYEKLKMLFHSTGVYKKLYKGGVGAHRYVFTARLFFLLMGCIHYIQVYSTV